MRKAIVTALIALTVMLALVSCDGILTGQDADGLVTLSVNTGGTAGNSRSLTDALAHGNANFVEVIFVSGSKYYRAQGYLGQIITIKVPTDSYNATNAVLLIGKKGDGTLLATGVPHTSTAVPGVSEIVFDVTALVADISTTGSAFVVDTTSGSYPDSLADQGFTPAKIKGLLFEEDTDSVCFKVPINTDGIKVSLTIGGLTSIGTNAIIVAATGDATKYPDSVTFTPIGSAPSSPIDGNAATVTPAIGSVVPASGAFEILFDSTGAGQYIITFDIPVVGFGQTTTGIGSALLTWYIRGGTESGRADHGALTGPLDNPAEGVPLLVTDNPNTLHTITVTPDWP